MKIQMKEIQKGMRIRIGKSVMNYSYEVLNKSEEHGLIVLTMQPWSTFGDIWKLRRRPSTIMEVVQ